MGADGGSIPRREELVKTKAKQTSMDPTLHLHTMWCLCALSKEPLKPPIASCALGKLYNKEALLQYLLDPSSDGFGDAKPICGHIESLKDIVTLEVTPNPSYTPGLKNAMFTAPFLCPVTRLEMNGKHPFVYLRECGHVLARQAFKELQNSLCPLCPRGKTHVTLNPRADTAQQLLDSLKQRRLDANEARMQRKKGKRKRNTTTKNTDLHLCTTVQEKDEHALDSRSIRSPTSSNHATTGVQKHPRVQSSAVPSSSSSSSSSSVVAVAVAAAVAATHIPKSEAIAQIYFSKKNTKRDDTYLNRATYTRYA